MTAPVAEGAARQPVVKSTKPGVIRYKEHPQKPPSQSASKYATNDPRHIHGEQRENAGRERGTKPSSSKPTSRRPSSSKPAASKPAASKPNSGSKSSAKKFAAPGRKSERSNYQPIILAEFVLAVLLVAATPIATKKNPEGLSPYRGKDVVKIEALTLLYFLLALTSAGGRSWGRVGAWLGGLILLVVGLGEASNLAKDLNIFGSGKLGAAEGSAAAGEGSGGSLKGNLNG